jgi:hypothetical protein
VLNGLRVSDESSDPEPSPLSFHGRIGPGLESPPKSAGERLDAGLVEKPLIGVGDGFP